MMTRYSFFLNKNSFREQMNFWITVLSIITIISSLTLILFCYAANRSLWSDEAMLAFSFSKRNLMDLTSSILEYHQTAPILYLYIVKIITTIFGNSEFTLRIFSAFQYLGMLCLSFLLLKKVFKVKFAILYVAVISSLPIMIRYANEFKPYMNDCFCVLMVIYIHVLYFDKKLSLSKITG